MDLAGWKQATRERLQGMAQVIQRKTPGAVYGALSAAAILPVVTAFSQGDFSILVTLGGVLAGVGGNLIANQIQAWKDKSDAELADELAQKAKDDAEWRKALDKLMQTLETPRLAQASLAPADRAWLVETLNQDLTRLGSDIRVEGDGNVVVAGNRNIAAAGDMTGNLNVTGDNATIMLAGEAAEKWLRSLKLPARSLDNLQAVTKTYLNYLITRYRYLDFKGMGISDRVPLRISLEDMYIPLKARVELPPGERSGWQDREGIAARELRLAGRHITEDEAAAIGERLSAPQPLLDLLKRYDGLIILGDPGAGKTTFLKYLTLRLAQGQGDELGLAGRLPILVPLSAYANAIAKRDVPLQDFLGDYYHNQGIDLPVGELLGAALAQGRALVMFDGLDEVASRKRRGKVVERVVALFAYECQRGNKFLLTSRIVGYREVRPTADRLGECTVVDFDDDDIEAFVGQWSTAIEQAARGASDVTAREAAVERDELLDATRRNPSVGELAANPLLLTILALMKRQGVTLPDRRVQLYDTYVKTLLYNWNLARGLERGDARELNLSETLTVLAPLALWMQETSPGRGLVKQQAVSRELTRIYADLKTPTPDAAAEKLLADVRESASLLLERGPGEYGFIHLTFQEYLAAVGIAQQGQLDVAPVAELLARHVQDATWREVALLTVGYLGIVQQRPQAAGDVVRRLISSGAGAPGAAVVLAGEAVADAWPEGIPPDCKAVVVQALLDTMRDDGRVEAPLRAAAGDALAKLGDPRFRADAWFLPDEPLLGFVEVPAGPFLMGSDKRKDRDTQDNELPQHPVELPTFYIARYPVTVAQFKAFVDASGYQPRDPDCLRDPLNRPVRYVTWHEALDYGRWLTETLRAWEGTPQPLAARLRGSRGRPAGRITLPSEAEWEKAARGTDGRAYSWGDTPDPNRANYWDTRIGNTSAVGCFPSGASPYAAEEMAGNLWEWCRTKWVVSYTTPGWGDDNLEGNATRCVRGGSWLLNQGVARCASRDWNLPLSRNIDLGFRVIVSPPTE